MRLGLRETNYLVRSPKFTLLCCLMVAARRTVPIFVNVDSTILIVICRLV